MGNWKLTTAQQPQALTREALAALRHGRAAGLSRRTLLRRSLGAGVALWLTETLAGTIGFMWPHLSSGFGRAGHLAPRRRPVLLPGGAHVRPADRPDARLRARRERRRRGHEPQRAHALPALPAPRLQAELLHQELLVRVPLPRLALCPSGHQGGGLWGPPAQPL